MLDVLTWNIAVTFESRAECFHVQQYNPLADFSSTRFANDGWI